VECSTINIDDYEQFPPLGKEEFTSTPAKSFSVPSVDPDTTINYSDISGLNVVFKILMFISAGPLTTGYTELIGLPITVLAACMVHVHE
jgi:hypothetical protein